MSGGPNIYAILADYSTTDEADARYYPRADVDGLVAAKAPLASPPLTGTPTAPTAAAGTNTTQLATTAFCRNEIAALVNAAPADLDTLGELAARFADDEDIVTALTSTVAGKLAKAANLSDLASAATARTNLGLGALAVLGISPTLNNLTTTFAATVGTTLTVLDPTTGLGGVAIHDSILTLAGGVVGLNPADPSVFALGLQVGGAGINGDTPGMVFDTTGDTAVTDYRTAQFRNLGTNTFGWELADGLFHTFGNADTHHRWAGDTKTDNSGTVYEHAALWGLDGSIFTPLTLAPTATSGTLLTVNAPSGYTAGGRLLDLQNNGTSRYSFNDGRASNGTMMKIVVPSFNGTTAFLITLGNGSTTGFSVDDSGNVFIAGNLTLGRISLNQANDNPVTTLSAAPTYNPSNASGYTLTAANISPKYQINTLNASSFLVDLYVNRTEQTFAGAATTYTTGSHYLFWFGVGGTAKITGSTSGNLRLAGNLGVGNSAAATTLGAVVKKVQIFDAAGTSLGYIPVYDSIT